MTIGDLRNTFQSTGRLPAATDFLSPEVNDILRARYKCDYTVIADILWACFKVMCCISASTFRYGIIIWFSSLELQKKKFGWNCILVKLEIKEFQSGNVCVIDLTERFKPKSEEKNPKIVESIRKLIAPYSQANPHKTAFLYWQNS